MTRRRTPPLPVLPLAIVALSGCGLLVGITDLGVAPSVEDGGTDGTQLVPPPDTGTPDVTVEPEPDAGCPVTTTVFKQGTTATGTNGSKEWRDPDDARIADDAPAKFTLALNDPSPQLEVRGFGFAIPVTAQITGISVRVTRAGNHLLIKDASIVLLGPERVGDDRKVTTSWPLSIEPKVYGGQTDRWNVELTPELVNAPSFGVGVAAIINASGFLSPPPAAVVDEIAVAVSYCP